MHALLLELIPGGVKRSLTANAAGKALYTVTAATTADQVRTRLIEDPIEDLIDDVRRCDRQLADNTARMKPIFDEHATSLTDIVEIGPVFAARVLAGTRDPWRFPIAAAYANYTGTAPMRVASGDYNRHRLSRYGNRDLNSALHFIAVIQIRTRTSAARRYYDRKIAEERTSREAIRCLNVTWPCSRRQWSMTFGHVSSRLPQYIRAQLDNTRGTIDLILPPETGTSVPTPCRRRQRQ